MPESEIGCHLLDYWKNITGPLNDAASMYPHLNQSILQLIMAVLTS